jgi:MFS family permease
MVIAGIGSFVFAAATTQPVTLIAAALMGGGWMAAAGVGINTFMSERLPDGDRSSYTTTFMQMAFGGLILGPLLGTAMLDAHIDLVTVLFIGGVLRIIAGVLIQLFSIFQTEQNRYPILAAIKTLR